MLTSKRFVIVLVLTTACAAIAVAQPVTFTSRLTGRLIGANASSSGANYFASVSLTPVQLENGTEAYAVAWSLTTITSPLPVPPPPGPPPDLVALSVGGFLAISEVRLSPPSGTLSVDLDVARLRDARAWRLECVGGNCTSSVLISFPLKGTFTPLTGVGGFTFRQTGSQEFHGSDPICTSSNSLNGSVTGGSATFAGTMGTTPLVPPPFGPNASLFVQTGLSRYSSVCTPPPMP